MRQIFVAGNWKMNGSLEANQQLIDGLKAGMSDGVNAEVAICPPAVYLPQIADLLADSDISWGGQDSGNAAGNEM
jgi:triosephosphate isomerase